MPDNRLISRLDDVQEQSLDRLRSLMESLVEAQLGPHGRAFGDEDLAPEERIARFVDLAERGVLDVIETISPPTFKLLVEDVQDAMARSPLVKGLPR